MLRAESLRFVLWDVGRKVVSAFVGVDKGSGESAFSEVEVVSFVDGGSW